MPRHRVERRAGAHSERIRQLETLLTYCKFCNTLSRREYLQVNWRGVARVMGECTNPGCRAYCLTDEVHLLNQLTDEQLNANAAMNARIEEKRRAS